MILQDITKQFIEWTKNKIRHHVEKKDDLYFREKEIWWVALGKNIGYEIGGKHKLFERQVLILKKYSKDMCFVLPLTTQIKDPKPWYQVTIKVENKLNAVNISQGRTISRKRLLRKITVLETEEYNNIINLFVETFKNEVK